MCEHSTAKADLQNEPTAGTPTVTHLASAEVHYCNEQPIESLEFCAQERVRSLDLPEYYHVTYAKEGCWTSVQ